jgi:UDP-2,3-diacylglucosamine hydrolase
MDVTETEVNRVMAAHDVDCLIHGHTHRPARHESRDGERWVLGDWDQAGWAIEATPGKLNLYSFTI